MWDIYNSLSYENMVPMIQSGQASIKQARMMASSYLNEKSVYVGRANNYFESADDDTLIVHRDDMILVYGVDSENVFNEICTIMEGFESWEQTLDQLEEDENGLQLMLDASKDIICTPCYVYAPDGRAYAIAQGYSPDIHWHWAEILDNNGISSGRIRSLRDSINLPEVWKDTFPTTRDSQMGDHTYMHCSLYPNGYMAAHFVLFSFQVPFKKGLERVANIMVHHMTRHMENYYARYSPTSKLAEAFIHFLEKDAFAEEDIALALRALRWEITDSFRVYVVREQTTLQPVLLSQLYNDITNRFIFAIAFTYADSLVIIENDTRQKRDVLLSYLSGLLKGEFYCGVSMIFSDLHHFRTYYLQADHEAQRCLEDKVVISLAREHGIDQIHSALRADALLPSYIAPELTALAAYDKEHASSYYESLRACVFASFQLSEAARMLGIHRNSLSYRLEKMHEICDMSHIDKAMSTHDLDAIIYLMLSFSVFEAHS